MANDTRSGTKDTTRPSKAFTKDQLASQADIKHQNKMDAVNPELIIKADDQWRELSTYWASATVEERKSTVFGLTMNNGAKPKDIARLFDIKPDELKPFTSVVNQAIAALKLKIQGNQITSGFMNDTPMMKFFMGKQFGEQVENPQHEDVKSIDEGAGAITIKVLTKEDAPDYKPSIIATVRGIDDLLQ